jgi:hypothetical protein
MAKLSCGRAMATAIKVACTTTTWSGFAIGLDGELQSVAEEIR